MGTIVKNGKEYASSPRLASDILYDNSNNDLPGTVQTAVDGLKSNVDELSGQVTETNSNVEQLSAQVSEMNSNVEQLSTQVGETNQRIDDCFQSVSDGKALVASAITGKGITTASDATFETMAANIGSIKQLESDSGSVYITVASNGNSTTVHVNFNKTFSKVPTVGITNGYTYFFVTGISNITTTGFDLSAKSNGVKEYTATWAAFAG